MAIGPSRFHIFRFPFPLLQPDHGGPSGGGDGICKSMSHHTSAFSANSLAAAASDWAANTSVSFRVQGIPSNCTSQTTPWAPGLRSLCAKNSSFPLSSIWARTRSSWPAASPEEKNRSHLVHLFCVVYLVLLLNCLTNNNATNCSFQSLTHDRKFGPAFLACSISSNFARPSDSASRTSSNCRTCCPQLQATKKTCFQVPSWSLYLLPCFFCPSYSLLFCCLKENHRKRLENISTRLVRMKP